jgi:hypothetical protein
VALKGRLGQRWPSARRAASGSGRRCDRCLRLQSPGRVTGVELYDAQRDDVITAYHRYYELSKGDRQDRLCAEADYWWAHETVSDAVRDGTLPLDVLDALVGDPEGDSDYRAYIAAGPLEDLLNEHADMYADPFADRARVNGLWAEALGGVWLDSATWTSLPQGLRPFISEPRSADAAVSTPQQRIGRRPSKRQGHRSR